MTGQQGARPARRTVTSRYMASWQGSKVLDLLAEPLADGMQPCLKCVGDQVRGAWVEKVHSSRGLTQMIERGMSRRKTEVINR